MTFCYLTVKPNYNSICIASKIPTLTPLTSKPLQEFDGIHRTHGSASNYK